MITAIPLIGFAAVLVWMYFQGMKARREEQEEDRRKQMLSKISEFPSQTGTYGGSEIAKQGGGQSYWGTTPSQYRH